MRYVPASQQGRTLNHMKVDTSKSWDASATVVKLGDKASDPQLLFEGTLAAAALSLGKLHRSELASYRLALPDRPFRPRSYQGSKLEELVEAAIIHNANSKIPVF